MIYVATLQNFDDRDPEPEVVVSGSTQELMAQVKERVDMGMREGAEGTQWGGDEWKYAALWIEGELRSGRAATMSDDDGVFYITATPFNGFKEI